MVSIVFAMNSGIAGTITRPVQYPTVESAFLDATTNTPTLFGVPVKISAAGKLRAITAGDTFIKIAGFLVRPYPTSGNGTDGLGVAVPNTTFPADLLKNGYIAVQVNNYAVNAPTKNGSVYVRVGNPSGVKVIGGIEAAGDIAVTAAATVGTGTQTAGTLSATDVTPAGVYTVKMLTGTTFQVTSAGGAVLLTGGVFATQYTLDNGLSFKMTTGGTPTAGDTTAITVTQNTISLTAFGVNTYFTGGADANGISEIAYNV